MFTGLVQATAALAEVHDAPPGKRLMLTWPSEIRAPQIGDSIALNGCCLTVVLCSSAQVAFEAGPETLSRTNLGLIHPGDLVNLECSLKLGDPLGGHLVTGHVDALGELLERQDDREWSVFWFSAPPAQLRQMASKGSIAIDGVSLTLVDVQRDRFSVALIPHTLRVTTLGRLAVGDRVNLETDLLAKYVERQLAGGEQAGTWPAALAAPSHGRPNETKQD